MKQLNKIKHDNLFTYVKVDNNALRINFDGLCQYLFKYEHRNFSVSEFENTLNEELNTKLVGQPINAQTLKNVCDYIDSLSLYLTAKFNSINSGNIESASKDFYKRHEQVYQAALERARKRNPNEYEALKARFNKRLGNA